MSPKATDGDGHDYEKISGLAKRLWEADDASDALEEWRAGIESEEDDEEVEEDAN